MAWIWALATIYVVVAVFLFLYIMKEGVYGFCGLLALILIPLFWPIWLIAILLVLFTSLPLFIVKTKKQNDDLKPGEEN